ncbi:MAG: AAA family ATPase, partial [Treponema sp.]|nr:AAA family ATPase [Treponema sp.]
MFLKRLTILGFKSFAERTEIEFCDGITALLGPNGCGKSNVVDAVKWVLGEHASKSLRAEKMEDVIFNGTETRKPLGMAEVTLTLANEAGVLPLDMPEIEIKRRLYRSGESMYLINGAQVRLKDLRELFWDTGVGKAAYSVMEQGKIDQALSSKPEDRRYLFEEVAGITRFKERGAEAGQKLAKTEENMRQVELILNEVKRSHDSLKQQAEKTKKYRTLRDEIFNYELDIQLLKLKKFRYERNEYNETLKKRTADRDRIRSEMEAENRALEANMDEVNSMEARLVELQKNIYGLALEKNAKEGEARLLNEQGGEIKIKIGQNEGREKHALTKIDELNEDASGQDNVVNELLKQARAVEDNIKSFEENIQLAAGRIGDNETAVVKAEEEIHRIEKEQAVLEKNLAVITDDIVAKLDAGLKKAGYSAAERRSAETALHETLGRLRTILAGRETLIRDLASAAAGGAAVEGAELKRIAERLAATLADAAADAEKAISLFENYREQSPAFIDEFLSPQGIITQKRALDEKIREAKDGIEQRRQKIKALHGENVSLTAKIDEYRATLEDMRVSRARMKAQAQSAEEQARLIRREQKSQEGLLEGIRGELHLDRKRLEEINERITSAQEEIAAIEQKGIQLNAELETLEKDIQKRNANVAGRKEIINKRTAELSRVQEGLERIHLELVQSDTEIKNIQDNFRETHSRDLMEFEERIYTITAAPAVLRDKLAAARTQMRDLGSVNLMAPEEFAEIKERYDFLSGQMADLEKARKDLEDLTTEIRQEAS